MDEELLRKMGIDILKKEEKKPVETVESFLCPKCSGSMFKASSCRFESIIGIRPYRCDKCGLIMDMYNNQNAKRKVIVVEVMELLILILVLMWVL